jgi:Family of unknown function (DUF5681)
MSDDSEGKKVGYKRPPLHSRWKPGQSANPRGRTKGRLDLKTEVKLMLEAPVTVANDKGKSKKITTLRASLWRVREKALKGNDKSLAKILDLAISALGEPVQPTGDISLDDQAILDAFRREIEAEATKDKQTDDDSEDIK